MKKQSGVGSGILSHEAGRSTKLLLMSAAALAFVAGEARAQGVGTAAAVAEDTPPVGDIVVTARKRDETSIAVPVVVTAIGAAEIQRKSVTSIDILARLVPGFISGSGGSTIQGGIIALRGLSGADINGLSDQAVSFNIDGVQVARSSIRRMSELDLQQIEVLKGPQALFFGKNSPAGIISIRTADPTPDFRAQISTGYEINARQLRTDSYVSGPITSTLGVRVAAYYDHMRGWVKNIAPQSGPNVLPYMGDYSPRMTEYGGRVTLKWEPDDRFNARLKLNYLKGHGEADSTNFQLVFCPFGAPQQGGIDNCKADDRIAMGNYGPAAGRINPLLAGGSQTLRQYQILGGLELNYKLTDTLTLASVTGYYKLHAEARSNSTSSYIDTGVLPNQVIYSYNGLFLREASQELRLSSNFAGPGNFLIGGFYQDSRAEAPTAIFRSAFAPVFVANTLFVQKGRAYSIFGQVRVEPVRHIELTAGARYSVEDKKLPVAAWALAATPLTLDNLSSTLNNHLHFRNLSPEATLSYRPTNQLTIYGSYKEGFLSGGFNSAATNLTVDNSYKPQEIRGFEGGIKAALLNGALRTNLAVYSYKTSGLQVALSQNGVPRVLNAGTVRTKGVEFDALYRTPLAGLTLNGAVAYNRGRYLDYQATCYVGQPASQCFVQQNHSTGVTSLFQDLSGTQAVRAPEWTGNLGFTYDQPLTEQIKLGITGNATHSDSYETDVASTPGGRQKAYNLFDATVSLSAADDRWQLSFIGRNLTDKYYFVRSTNIPFVGGGQGTAAARLGDIEAPINRGRELMVRVTVRTGG